jgi:oxygen-dependent protoporphyrinogen oxidase
VTRVVVIGGGISGLSTAHAVLQRDPAVEVELLEQSPRLGGNIVTAREDGFVLDGGADSWVSAKPEATALAKSLGLEGSLIGTIPENRRALIAWGDRLHPLPEGFVLGVPTSMHSILRTPLFSARAKLRMMLEPLVPRHTPTGADDDESIDAFIRRRLGAEVAERLVAPLLGGIYGGDAGALSMRATLPQLLEMEAKHRSLIHAMKATQGPAPARRGGARPSMFTSLRGGVGSLVDRLVTSLGDGRIRTGVTMTRVSPLKDDPRGRFAVELLGGEIRYADHVVLAVPARVAATVLGPFGERLTSLLSAMPYVSTAVVAMAFARSDIAHPLDATGYIVPRAQGRPALAATWISSKWHGRAPDGQALLRVFLGGAGHEEVMEKEDAELERLARAELARSIALHAAPTWTRVFRFVRASPQPLVGHPGRMRKVKEILAESPGLHVVASGYDGVGIPDCVRQGEGVARVITGE